LVDSAGATVDASVANGGEIAQAISGDAPEITARSRDPDGNLVAISTAAIMVHQVRHHGDGRSS